MIKLVPFELSHIANLAPLMDIYDTHTNAVSSIVELAQREDAFAYSLIAGEVTIAVFVGVLAWGYCLDISALVTKQVRRYAKSFFKACQTLLDIMAKVVNVERFQFMVRHEYDRGRRLAERLGFLCDGISHHFGPDKAIYAQYGKVMV